MQKQLIRRPAGDEFHFWWVFCNSTVLRMINTQSSNCVWVFNWRTVHKWKGGGQKMKNCTIKRSQVLSIGKRAPASLNLGKNFLASAAFWKSLFREHLVDKCSECWRRENAEDMRKSKRVKMDKKILYWNLSLVGSHLWGATFVTPPQYFQSFSNCIASFGIFSETHVT